MSRTIQFAFHYDGYLISRVDRELAWPILDYEGIGRDDQGNFTGNYNAPLKNDLECVPVTRVSGSEWRMLVWTRYVPVELKNQHRAFWGMKPLRVPPPPANLHDLLREHKTRFYYVQPNAPGLVGVKHSTGGQQRGLYHWFKKVRRRDGLWVATAFLWLGVSDERTEGAVKREMRSLARDYSSRAVARVGP